MTKPPTTDPQPGVRAPEGLRHPLPAGMRDLLPAETRWRRELRARLVQSFELSGYQLVELPVLEYADVLELGLGSLDAQAVLRFVEPDSGEVVGLRPDMTAQVARMAATRLHDAPTPQRFCYQGSVVRRRHERARRHRQIPQAGIELLGEPSPAGDMEILETATAAVRASGLADYVLDLGHASVAGALLAELPESSRAAAVEALGRKDAAGIRRAVDGTPADASIRDALCALPSLHGGDEVWAEAERVFANTPAQGPAADLRNFVAKVTERGFAERITIDLGEVRSLDYYTGTMFQILAEGPGCAVGGGGRYDGLLARYGVDRPAAGFALDLDHLSWALQWQGRVVATPRKVLVALARGSDESHEMMKALRERRIPCAPAPDSDVDAYAERWDFTHVLEPAKDGGLVVRGGDTARTTRATDAETRADDVASYIAEDAPESQELAASIGDRT
jgi:ATP phosphoribosyltransferase regulatory subunit